MPIDPAAPYPGAQARHDVLAMLRADHRRLCQAFGRHADLRAVVPPMRAGAIVRRTCALLQLHATLEQELVYPLARHCFGDAEALDEAEVEHRSVDALVDRLQAMTPRHDDYGAVFRTLGQHVQRHIGAEEATLLPRLAATRADWAVLADQMRGRRAELERVVAPPARAAASGWAALSARALR